LDGLNQPGRLNQLTAIPTGCGFFISSLGIPGAKAMGRKALENNESYELRESQSV
jgi:hypothetical protein